MINEKRKPLKRKGEEVILSPVCLNGGPNGTLLPRDIDNLFAPVSSSLFFFRLAVFSGIYRRAAARLWTLLPETPPPWRRFWEHDWPVHPLLYCFLAMVSRFTNRCQRIDAQSGKT